MPTFVLLANFTDQGVRNIKDTISRTEAFKEMAKRSGITMKELCWTLGRHDVVAVFEAPDDESAGCACAQRLLARQYDVRDPARLLLRGHEDDPRQDGLEASPDSRP